MSIRPFEFDAERVPPGSAEEELLGRLDTAKLPRHLAVIMDGNGRWAAQRGLPRVEGHRRGARSVREAIENCARLGIDILTIYAFSSENWKRPQAEVEALMKMLSEFLRKELRRLVKNGIVFRPVGRWRELPPETVADIEEAIAGTAAGERMLFQVALNYGGRVEIADACRRIAVECLAGTLDPEEIGVETVAGRMYCPEVPDPDLLIRTSGEYRISNFLLWELAYTEIYVTDVHWPDFRLLHLLEALTDFQGRERRYGGLNGEGEGEGEEK